MAIIFQMETDKKDFVSSIIIIIFINLINNYRKVKPLASELDHNVSTFTSALQKNEIISLHRYVENSKATFLQKRVNF